MDAEQLGLRAAVLVVVALELLKDLHLDPIRPMTGEADCEDSIVCLQRLRLLRRHYRWPLDLLRLKRRTNFPCSSPPATCCVPQLEDEGKSDEYLKPVWWLELGWSSTWRRVQAGAHLRSDWARPVIQVTRSLKFSELLHTWLDLYADIKRTR